MKLKSVLPKTAFILCATFITNVNVYSDALNDSKDIQDTHDILEKLVHFRTVQGHGQVPSLAEFIRQKLLQSGFNDEDIQIKDIDGTAYLTAKYPGNGTSRPMLISSHMDVVEANPSDWTWDPFTLIEKNGYLFGRGTVDNKLDLALILQTVARLKREGFHPSRDILFAFSGDEETNMLTTEKMSVQFPDAEFLLNADNLSGVLDTNHFPLVYLISTAEKTYMDFRLSTSNSGGHSSLPQSDNAIYELASALEKISKYHFPAKLNEHTKSYFEYKSMIVDKSLGDAMRKFIQDPTDDESIQMIRNNPIDAASLSTTCVATMVTGGHAANALPQSASANINCRIFPGESIESVQNKLSEIIDNPKVKIEQGRPSFESGVSPLRDDVMDALRKAVDTNFPNLLIVPNMEPGTTDSRYFRAVGIPSYGVSGLYIRLEDFAAHGLNERIPTDAISKGLNHWYVLMKELSSN